MMNVILFPADPGLRCAIRFAWRRLRAAHFAGADEDTMNRLWDRYWKLDERADRNLKRKGRKPWRR